MFVINCVPLRKIPRGHPQVLSYFSTEELAPGYLVVGAIGKSTAAAVVVSCTSVREHKAMLRSQEYQLKPIERVVFDFPIVPSHYLPLLAWTADYFFAPLSYVFRSAFPPQKTLLSRTFQSFEVSYPNDKPSPSSSVRPRVLWGDGSSAIIETLSEATKNGGNALLTVPHEAHRNKWMEALERANLSVIEHRRTQGIRAWKSMYENLASAESSVVVGTPSAVFAPVSDLRCVVVVEEESSMYYRDIAPPYIDHKTTAKRLAQSLNATYVLQSEIPSMETFYEINETGAHMEEHSPIADIAPDIVDIRNNPKNTLIAPETRKNIERIVSRGKKVLIFLNRRGHASAVYCKDCGYTTMCDHCDVPLVYHTAEVRELVCHHCGIRKKPPNTCKRCQSNNLDLYGTGVQKVAEELNKAMEDTNVVRFDSDKLKKFDEETEALESFFAGSGGVMVATEMLFKHDIGEKAFDLAIIANFDQLLHIPDFRIEEQMRRSLVYMQQMSVRIAIQTYNPERKFFEDIEDLREAMEKELSTRKKIGYPPYSQMVRVIFAHKNEKKALSEATLFARKLKEKNIKKSPPIPSFIAKKKNVYRYEIVLWFDRLWKKEELKKRNGLLQLAPPTATVMVDPQQAI